MRGAGADERAEDGFFIVADDVDFFNAWDTGYGCEAVGDDAVAGDIKERLCTD